MRVEELECDGPVVSKILREIDGCHPAATQLALDPVALGESLLEAIERL